MKFYIYTIILFLSFNILEAQPKFKNKAAATKQISTFGDINFETELNIFQNSSNRKPDYWSGYHFMGSKAWIISVYENS